MSLMCLRFQPSSFVRRINVRKYGSAPKQNTSPLFLGTYQLNPSEVADAVKSAIRMGYRRIDCAPIYFNEMQIGDILAMEMSKGSVNRKDLFIGSKLPSPFHRKEHVKIGLQKTLTDLRLDYLDQYIIHWPTAFHFVDIDPFQRGYENEEIGDSDGGKRIDPTVSIHDTWEGMEELVDEGLVRSIGVSNFTVSLLHELMTRTRIPPALNQIECHPYLQQTKLIDYCKMRHVQIQAYSPLGSPLSSSKKAGHFDTGEPQVLQDPILKKIAKRHDATVAQVCIAWALQRGTSVVVKSASKERQRENLLQNIAIQFSKQELKEIESLDRGYRYFRPDEWWRNMAVFS